MKKCKNCGTELNGSNVCPSCGKKQRSLVKTIIVVFLILLFGLPFGLSALVGIWEAIDYAKMTPEQKVEYDAQKKLKEEEKRKEERIKIEKEISETDNSVMVYQVTKDYVKNNLKSPSSAKFPSMNYVQIYKNGATYTVNGYVDAQNSFGATLRTKYTITIKQTEKDGLSSSSYQVQTFKFIE